MVRLNPIINLTAPSGAFAVGGNMGIKYLYYYALGKFDCAIGNEALEGQSEAYYDGYNDQYQNEQNQGAEE